MRVLSDKKFDGKRVLCVLHGGKVYEETFRAELSDEDVNAELARKYPAIAGGTAPGRKTAAKTRTAAKGAKKAKEAEPVKPSGDKGQNSTETEGK